MPLRLCLAAIVVDYVSAASVLGHSVVTFVPFTFVEFFAVTVIIHASTSLPAVVIMTFAKYNTLIIVVFSVSVGAILVPLSFISEAALVEYLARLYRFVAEERAFPYSTVGHGHFPLYGFGRFGGLGKGELGDVFGNVKAQFFERTYARVELAGIYDKLLYGSVEWARFGIIYIIFKLAQVGIDYQFASRVYLKHGTHGIDEGFGFMFFKIFYVVANDDNVLYPSVSFKFK